MFDACDGSGSPPGTNCRMDAFDKEEVEDAPQGIKHAQYVYVPHKEAKPYFDMAHEWVVADRMFASQLDESFVAHQYTIAAQAASAVNTPSQLWGCEGDPADLIATITLQRRLRGPPEHPCFDYETLGDELDAAKLSWRFYASAMGTGTSGIGFIWSAYQAVRHIYDGPDWKNDVLTPNWKFITDVRAGKLASFTWITPVCATPITSTAAAATGRPGSPRSLIRWGKVSSGTRPQSSCNGTTGAACTITFLRRMRITTASAFAFR